MQLHIQDNYGKCTTDLWLSDKRGDVRCYYSWDGQNIIETSVNPAVAVSENTLKPFLSIPSHFANEFISLVADHANKQGVKTERRDFMEGELMATKKHLEDLQKAFNALIATV